MHPAVHLQSFEPGAGAKPYETNIRVMEEESQRMFDQLVEQYFTWAPFLNQNKEKFKQNIETCNKSCLDTCSLEHRLLMSKIDCFNTCQCLDEHDTEYLKRNAGDYIIVQNLSQKKEVEEKKLNFYYIVFLLAAFAFVAYPQKKKELCGKSNLEIAKVSMKESLLRD